MAEPNWLVAAAVGAALWPTITAVFFLVRYLFRRFMKSNIVGEWHHYYFNWDSNVDKRHPVFKHEVWNIKPGLRHPYFVSVSPHDGEGPTYSGKLKRQNQYWVFSLEANNHDETVVEIIPHLITDGLIRKTGVAIAQDWDSRAAVAAVMLSNEELDADVCISEFAKKTVLSNKKRVIRLI